MGAAKNLGVHLFPNPVGHFGVPCCRFWTFEVLKEGMVELKTYLVKVIQGQGGIIFSLPGKIFFHHQNFARDSVNFNT